MNNRTRLLTATLSLLVAGTMTACNDVDDAASALESGAGRTSADTTPVPAGDRSDANDKGALPAEMSDIPNGPLTKLQVVRTGSTNQTDSRKGDFYAVFKADSTGTGAMWVSYKFLGADGNELGSSQDTISLGEGQGIYKVTQQLTQVPQGTEKVRIIVQKVGANPVSNDTTVEEKFSYSTDAIGDPVVSGRYKTVGNNPTFRLNAVCVNADGEVQTSGRSVSKFRTSEWNNYAMALKRAPEGYTPQACYVGSS